MSRFRSLLPLALLGAFLVAGRAGAGIGGADPREIVRVPGLGALRVTGKVKAVGWQGHGRSTAPRAVSVSLAELRVTPPPGLWTDLVLELDGPLLVEGTTTSGDPLRLVLTVDRLVVPLEDPDAVGPFGLDLELPGWLAAEDGLTVSDGHPQHDTLVSALRDGALAVPAR